MTSIGHPLIQYEQYYSEASLQNHLVHAAHKTLETVALSDPSVFSLTEPEDDVASTYHVACRLH